jgi:hypothetical protein
MKRDKPSSKLSLHGRPIAYDREIFIEICRKALQGEKLNTICAKPPMPVGPVFLGWVQDHQEAREIYRCACNFKSDRKLAKELTVPWAIPVGEWEEEVRAKLERGWPVDYIDRKYIPPDWNKVYPLLGGPPVWSTESMQAYTDLINGFTQMLEPRDDMELIWTKEAADATWEVGRLSRQKAQLAERRYRKRLEAQAECARTLAQHRREKVPDLAAIMAKTPTGDDLDRGHEERFPHYQALDIAQSRASKRRDNALRQIAHWRDGLGGKAQALSDKFVAEEALAERYVDEFLADGEIEAIEAPPPLVPSGEIAQTRPAPASAGEVPVPPMDATAGVASSIGASGETAEAASPLAPAGRIAQTVRPLAPAGQVAQTAPSVGSSGETAKAPRSVAPEEAAEGINWVGWLTGAESYHWFVVQLAARKKFGESFTSKEPLVRHLVLDCKLIPPDRVCPELARHLPAIAEAAPPLAPAAKERNEESK